MKTLLLAPLLFIVINFTTFSQTVETVKSNFDPSGRIFDKKTGEKISDEQFSEFIKNDPRVSLEPVVNKYGNVDKYLLDTSTRTIKKRESGNQTKPGEQLPEFVFKSIDEVIVNSSELNGKWILLKFEIFLKMVDSLSLVKLDEEIKSLDKQDDLVVISCFMEGKSEIVKKLNTNVSNIHIIPNARNFHIRYNIVRMPTIILLDPDGNVVRYYYSNHELDLSTITSY
jgi:hypothetical protein